MRETQRGHRVCWRRRRLNTAWPAGLAFLILLLATGRPIALARFEPDIFPINPWCSFFPSGLGTVVDCNFTVANFFVDPEQLAYVESLGLKAIVPSGLPRNYGELAQLSDEEIETTVREAIDAAGDSDTVLGYFLIDEPGAVAFHALSVAVETVNTYAPGKLAYINLFPNYARPDQLGTSTYEQYLQSFVDIVDPHILSYDNYQGQYESSSSYYTNLAQVRGVALEHDLPFWNFVASCRLGSAIPTAANLRLQAYSSLTAGAEGLSWYRYYNGGHTHAPIDDPYSNTKSQTWWDLQEVNRRVLVLAPTMKRLTSTGVCFTSPAPDGSLELLPGRVVQSVNSNEPLMVGEFIHANGFDYVMVTNMSLDDSATFTMNTVGSYGVGEISMVRPDDGEWVPADISSGVLLAAGEGVLIRFGLVLGSYTWALDAVGNWSTEENWDVFEVPDADKHTAVFGSAILASRTVLVDADVTVKAIRFDNINSYTVAGTSGVTLEADAGNAEIAVLRGHHEFQAPLALTDHTDIDVAASSSLTLTGVLDLSGKTLTKTGDGTLRLDGNQSVGSGVITVEGGALSGGGRISGHLANVSARVAPGGGVGTLTVEGNFAQGAGGTLEVELAGVIDGEFDVLEVLGTASLSGALDVVELYAPSGTDCWTILTAPGGITGDFDTITPGYEVFRVNASRELVLSPVGPAGPIRSWVLDGAGYWTQPANWKQGEAPNANSHAAVFGSSIDTAATVNVITGVTVKRIQFDTTHACTIVGTGGVTLEADAGNAEIEVAQGDHAFETQVNLNDFTYVEVAAGASLAFDGVLNLDGNLLNKIGDGALLVNGSQTGSGGTMIGTAGTIGGSGSIGGDLVNASAMVCPGESVGMLTVVGDFLQAVDGTLAIELNGSAFGQHDMLIVTGSASLAGVLDIRELYTPSGGDSWTILIAAGGITGGFDTITPGYEVTLTNNDTTLMLSLEGAPLPGDANGDGCVDDLDLTALAVHWQQSTSEWSHGDFNGDGIVDDLDLTALAVNWQQGCGGGGSFADALAAANVPEPATLSLLTFASVAFLRRRRS